MWSTREQPEMYQDSSQTLAMDSVAEAALEGSPPTHVRWVAPPASCPTSQPWWACRLRDYSFMLPRLHHKILFLWWRLIFMMRLSRSRLSLIILSATGVSEDIITSYKIKQNDIGNYEKASSSESRLHRYERTPSSMYENHKNWCLCSRCSSETTLECFGQVLATRPQGWVLITADSNSSILQNHGRLFSHGIDSRLSTHSNM